MKSLPRGAGNMNLRGKKRKQCLCGCCDVVNLKHKIIKREQQKEIRVALRGG